MEKNLNYDGTKDSDSVLSALQRMRHVICSEPRMLTGSEIKLLRQSKVEIGKRASELIAARKNRSLKKQGTKSNLGR